MNRKSELTKQFEGLSAPQKLYVLSALAHQITIHARGAYPGEVTDEQLKVLLPTLNEIQHNITSQLSRMLVNDSQRYPDDEFIQIIFEKAETGGCQQELIEAFNSIDLMFS